MLISSHILSELGEMCDSLLFMDRGKVVEQSDPEVSEAVDFAHYYAEQARQMVEMGQTRKDRA